VYAVGNELSFKVNQEIGSFKDMTNTKSILWLGFLGLIFGLSYLLVCLIAVLTKFVDDLGISLLFLPVITPLMLPVVAMITKREFGPLHYGMGGAIRWFVMGSVSGILYIVRVAFVKDETLPSDILGISLLLSNFIVYFLLFEIKPGRTRRTRKAAEGDNYDFNH
jgi:hypothetical protein